MRLAWHGLPSILFCSLLLQVCSPLLALTAGTHDDALSAAIEASVATTASASDAANAAAEAYTCLFRPSGRPTEGPKASASREGSSETFELALSALASAYPLLLADARNDPGAASVSGAAAVLTRLAALSVEGLAALSLSPQVQSLGVPESKADDSSAPSVRWPHAAHAAEDGDSADELAGRTLQCLQLLWELLAQVPEATLAAAGGAAVAAARPALTVLWGLAGQACMRLGGDPCGGAEEGKDALDRPPAVAMFADDAALLEAAEQMADVLQRCLE